ncbi:unnamed protein product [marine sediment metagenome]|uniref:Uncharacterized protein n=1 Tax=marine sediment metagenome TaxID=412755 RepID=X1PA43_9ZZZZ
MKPQKKIKGSKKIEPLRTPEGKNFRKEASKLDNWQNHYRITEYLNGKKPKEK